MTAWELHSAILPIRRMIDFQAVGIAKEMTRPAGTTPDGSANRHPGVEGRERRLRFGVHPLVAARPERVQN
jgi:hypothetical protein